MKTSHLEDMVVFARVVDSGSLTRAAKALRTTRSAVSKSVARLEAHLGTRLLHRTTRALSPTAAGEACYLHCARIAAEAADAERAASDLRSAPHGTLRVSCSLSLGLLLAPRLPHFSFLHPKVSLEFGLSEGVVDLVRGGVDLALRLGQRLPDSSLVVRKLAPYRRVLCASPTYLSKNPAPRSPVDLVHHNCLLRIGHDQWRFRSGKRTAPIAVRGNFRADAPELVRRAALAGLGVALLPSFVAAGDLAAGLLVPLLEPFVPQGAAIYAVYPNQRHLAPSARAFIDFVVGAVGEITR